MLSAMATAAASLSDALGLERRRFTVEEVERMVDAGLLAEDEPIQLIEGEFIVMSPQGPEHSMSVGELAGRLHEAYRGIGHVRPQCPIHATDTSLPEPDLAVVRGVPRDYGKRHPRGSDVLLVVEIAKTSQAIDRVKARVYAAASVPEYWIVDLVARRVDVHREPGAAGYGAVTAFDERAEISPPGTSLRWRVADLLP